jgi:hypothetical protein
MQSQIFGSNGSTRLERSAGQGASNGVVRDASAYRGSRFMDVWRALQADVYQELPQGRIGVAELRDWLGHAALLRAAERTLDSRADLLPPFRKLVHPFGIALRGTWRITRETPYTGYFATGSEGLLLARASDARGEDRSGRLRFLGLAGKLYPTSNPEHKQLLKTANFFTLENLGGSHTPRFIEASLTNDLLPLVPHLKSAALSPLGALLGPTFMLADRAIAPTQPMIRQLYPIAELGEGDPARAYGPRFLKLVGVADGGGTPESDLRRELDMRRHRYGIRFEIHVAEGRRLAPRRWQRIGEIHFTDSVTSRSTDTRLHFAHPRYERGRAERRAR